MVMEPDDYVERGDPNLCETPHGSHFVDARPSVPPGGQGGTVPPLSTVRHTLTSRAREMEMFLAFIQGEESADEDEESDKGAS